VFNVELLDNPDNTVSLHRSKALGEPPLLLGISAWAAAKNALSYVSGDEPPDLVIPATGEQILMLLTKYERTADKGAARTPAPLAPSPSGRGMG
jgi:xanthine dehydrogenase large subunit